MKRFVAEVERLLDRYKDEHELTSAVAQQLTEALAEGVQLDGAVIEPDPQRYVMYPLYVDPAGRFSVASAVWNVGQGTPVHGHETWGVVGIHSGQEHELRYPKPTFDGEHLTTQCESTWQPGDVTICCTTDDDIHQVSCAGDVPVVGIHVYGADIGTLRRRSYDPHTGEVSWFVSTWAAPEATAEENC